MKLEQCLDIDMVPCDTSPPTRGSPAGLLAALRAQDTETAEQCMVTEAQVRGWASAASGAAGAAVGGGGNVAPIVHANWLTRIRVKLTMVGEDGMGFLAVGPGKKLVHGTTVTPHGLHASEMATI